MASGICTKQNSFKLDKVSASSVEQWMTTCVTIDVDLWMATQPTCGCTYVQEVGRIYLHVLHNLRLLTQGKSLKLMIWRGMSVRTELYL
jgi:hypothetical protein